MYLMKYLFGLKLINMSERVAYFTKIAGKRRRLVQQQTNKRQLSMKYQQQYVRSRRKASILQFAYIWTYFVSFRRR